MRKRKISTKERSNEEVLYVSNVTKISKDLNGELVFETANEVTTDLAEGVALMMRMESSVSDIWNITISFDIENIRPERCLYWLTGGNSEWNTLEHYNKPWSELYIDFQKQYGMTIIDIVKNSRTLRDVRTQLMRKLNLPVLYEFALSKNMIR